MQNPFTSRIVAVIVSFIVGTLASLTGLEVTEGQVTSITSWVTEGLTGLGWVVSMLAYAISHKFISKKTNPSDTAI